MRRICNIFESRSYRGTGQPVFTPASITALILSVVSFLAAVFIIANYDEIAARIAIWVAGFLSSAFPVVVLILAAVYFMAKLKWKLIRSWW